MRKDFGWFLFGNGILLGFAALLAIVGFQTYTFLTDGSFKYWLTIADLFDALGYGQKSPIGLTQPPRGHGLELASW